jgi:hypothetical protein
MDNKTAMQELIDGLDLTKIANRDKLVMVKYIIAKCLELEKEQIIEAYEDGKQNGMESITNVNAYIIGEYYYNQTYNQNKSDGE